MRPLVAVSRPARRLNSVVFPEPEGPTKATDSEALISKSIPFNISSSPFEVKTVLRRPSARTMPSKSLISLSLILLSLTTFSPDWILAQNPGVDHDPVILVFGDSISTAYGMSEDRGWVTLLNRKLIENNHDYRLINASISGETTTGGLARLPQVLQTYKPSVVILELGGNDGLRGYPVTQIQKNLQEMIELCESRKTEVLLV